MPNALSIDRWIPETAARSDRDHHFRLNGASGDPLNPLAPPGRRFEGIREILCLVHNLTVAELHNTHCVCRPPLVGDGVFRDPEIAFSENSLDVET